VTRLRTSTHIERVALTLTTLAAFYAIWLGIGLPGLAPGAADGGRAPGGSVVVSQLRVGTRPVQRRRHRPATAPVSTVRAQTRLVSTIARPVVAAAPPAPTTAPAPAPAPPQPDRQPAVMPPPAAPPPVEPMATPAPTTPAPAPADVVESVAATAQSAVDAATSALPPVPDVPSVGSLVPPVLP